MSEFPQRTRVLFVCRQNKVRSLTAEQLYRERTDLEVRSAGTATVARNQLTDDLVTWADLIVVFDQSQTEAIESRFGNLVHQKQLVCLDLPDTFAYKSQSLVNKLTAKLEPYLGRPNSKKIPAGKPAVRPSPEPSSVFGKAGRSLVSQILDAVGVAVGRKKMSD